MPRQTYAGKVWKRGGSIHITIKPAVAVALGMRPGDTVIMSTYGPHLIIRRVGPDDVLRIGTIPVDALPGARAEDTNAR
jgi:hypothetical protein